MTETLASMADVAETRVLKSLPHMVAFKKLFVGECLCQSGDFLSSPTSARQRSLESREDSPTRVNFDLAK